MVSDPTIQRLSKKAGVKPGARVLVSNGNLPAQPGAIVAAVDPRDYADPFWLAVKLDGHTATFYFPPAMVRLADGDGPVIAGLLDGDYLCLGCTDPGTMNRIADPVYPDEIDGPVACSECGSTISPFVGGAVPA